MALINLKLQKYNGMDHEKYNNIGLYRKLI